MPNPWFRFKQFTVQQDQCAMKVSTDGVLLGAWACHGAPRKVLDIGTGTGLLALIAAQRCPDAMVHAVELDPLAAEQARENAATSPWADRIQVHHADIRQWPQDLSYDLVLCNPPFYRGHRASRNARLATAKHEDLLDLGLLLRCIAGCCAPHGRACLIFPADRWEELRGTAADHHLVQSRLCAVRHVGGQAAKRVLVEFTPAPAETTVTTELSVQEQDGAFTPEYRTLLRDLELHF